MEQFVDESQVDFLFEFLGEYKKNTGEFLEEFQLEFMKELQKEFVQEYQEEFLKESSKKSRGESLRKLLMNLGRYVSR